MIITIFKFIMYSIFIVLVSKNILVKILRNLSKDLNLSAKRTGGIAGIATSIPEFLTVSFASAAGLGFVSIYNILSSNVINFIQYIISILINKNQKQTRNKGIKIQLILTLITILVPLTMIMANISFSMQYVLLFVVLFIMFRYININIHKVYFNNLDDEENEKKIDENNEIRNVQIYKKNKSLIIIKYSIYIFSTAVLLYFVGEKLTNVLEELLTSFNVPQYLIGISLGIITSVPELTTFIESQRHHKNKIKNEGVIEATNNLLTSNMMNLFIIQSIGILISIFI